MSDYFLALLIANLLLAVANLAAVSKLAFGKRTEKHPPIHQLQAAVETAEFPTCSECGCIVAQFTMHEGKVVCANCERHPKSKVVKKHG